VSEVLKTGISTISVPLIIIIISLWVLLSSVVLPGEKKHFTGIMSALGLIASMLYLWGIKNADLIAFGNAVKLNSFVVFLWFVLLSIALAVVLSSQRFVDEVGIPQGEYNFFVLIATAGLLFLVSTGDLIMIFISIEILSLSFYVLAGIRRSSAGGESAVKYFVLGSLGAAMLVMGIALIYGSTGTVNLSVFNLVIGRIEKAPVLLAGIIFVITGLAFKIALVPFHMWVPDVYEGSPTPVSGFMAAGVKAGGVIALLRIYNALPSGHYTQLFWWLSVLTMVAGNLMALPQTSIKRILAYSSVAHAGYMIVGFLGGEMGGTGIMFYLIVYSAATLGAFFVVLLLERSEIGSSLQDISGMSRRHPFLSAAMAVFVLSLAGIPPLAGFFGKFYIFSSAVKSGYTDLVIIAVLMSVVSLYYYLRIVVAMYMEDEIIELLPKEYKSVKFIVFVLMLISILFGLFSDPVMSSARAAIKFLM
jgi:NADH-quinone oxidoreductase subunit N